jgi:phytoene dehydrogenase-like protein
MTAPTGPWDAVVIGAGHNGLVCATYLARGGLRTLVVERREELGGALSTANLAPGYRVPAAAVNVGRLSPRVVQDLRLADHRLSVIRPTVRAHSLQPDGRAVTLFANPNRTAAGLAVWSPADGASYPIFDRKVRALASFVAYLNAAAPPDLKAPDLADALGGLRLARAFRGLSRRASREVFRALPMAIADFVGEAFESDPVRATVAVRAVQYTAMGPWSAGTTNVLLTDSAGTDGGAAGPLAFARGGPSALARVLLAAGRAAGVDVMGGVGVERILNDGDRATGVVLEGGREIRASVVVSGADPKSTLLDLCDPVALGPTLVWRAANIRTPGTVSKVNLAVSRLPALAGLDAGDERLTGRILLGATGIDDVERAFDASKYGRISERPFLEVTIPSLLDPSLAPEGGHVLSCLLQWTPAELREGAWSTERDGVGDLVLKQLEEVAPGLSDAVVARQVLTPLDLERDFGMAGGHPFHAEPSLDQFFAWRPLLGHAGYRFGLRGLYLCGAGAHPGGGITGLPGRNAARRILLDRRRG